MGWFIAAVLILILAGVGFAIARSAKSDLIKLVEKVKAENAAYDAEPKDRYSTRPPNRGNEEDNLTKGAQIYTIAASVLTALGLLFLTFSMVYTQGVGEAKVLVNLDGSVAGEDLDTGFGIKAPWQHFSDWDLFSQEAVFAGNGDGTPSYSGGQVTGFEITSAVARGAQTNFDLSVTYTLDADQITPLYNHYRDQERFTKQVVEKTILSLSRDIPTQYTPVEFRGDKRGEATDRIFKALNKKLNAYGIQIDLVNLQNIRYTKEVEDSIRKVEVAQQKEETAAAELRATTISAQSKVIEATAQASAEIAAAKGTAEANRLLTASLSPQILQSRYLDAMGKGTVYVVPAGSTPLITTK